MEKIIELSGRIDSNYIEKEEDKILDSIKNHKGEITLDASKLEYISSVGLRMVLKIKKMNDNTKIINCNSEIYEIFEMTGFTEMMDISKTFRTISINNCEEIGNGFYGKDSDSLDMVKREKELARKAFILGIPTAIPYDIVKVGDTYGAIFELLNSKSLEKLVEEGANIEKLAKECVKILKKMHETEVNINELPNRKDTIIEWANYCKKELSKETYEELIDFINNIEDKNTMIHGDFQIKNLMKQDNEVLLIDMDTLSYGNPIFEFGAMFATYVAFSCINHDNPMEFLGISYEKSNELWECIYNDYYKDKSTKEKETLLEKIKILSYLEVLFIRSKYKDENNKYLDEEIEFCKNYLTKNLPKIISNNK